MPITLVNPYCTEAQVRAEIKDTQLGVVDQDLILKSINTASRWIDYVCSGGVANSRRFWKDAAPVTRTFQCEDRTFVYLDDIATKSGLIIKTDNDDDGTYEATWTAGVDYDLWPLNADASGVAEPMAFWKVVAVGDKTFPLYERRAGLQVTATWGWPAIPKQVEEACILKSIALLLRKDSPMGVLAQGDFGALKIPKEDPDVNNLLEPFIKTRPWSMSYASDQARSSMFHRRQYRSIF